MAAALPQGERRQLAVLFCDLVDSTPLAERFDPEELAEVYGIWQEACSNALEAHGGYISDYRGDSVLAFFGYPSAREDGPRRAVQAGLAIMRALQDVNRRLKAEYATTLAVRIGIHSGLVLLSDLGGRFSRDQFALGETPNIAARLEALAQPNEIIVSGAMRALTRGYFAFEEIGDYTLKGVSRTVEACRVIGETGAVDRIDAGRERGLTEFVARDFELAELHRLYRAAHDGRGGAALLIGEPGIGKSRLLETLAERVSLDGGQCVVLRCSPYHTATALHPVIAHVKRFLRLERDETPASSFSKLVRGLRVVGLADADGNARLIAQLLGFPSPKEAAPAGALPPGRRVEAIASLLEWLERSAARRPMLFVVEDVHWADPSLIDLLSALDERLAATSICAVLTTRPEGAATFAARPSLIRIALSRLEDADASALARRAARERELDEATIADIVARADGVPLFIEELVANLFEFGRIAGANPAIPLTIENLAAARLDRRPEARPTAQLAATLGRQFTWRRLREVSKLEDAALRAQLEALVEADLVLQLSFGPDPAYRFKHALIQDVAYASMLRGRRLAHHLAIADAMDARRPGFEDAATELVAHHLTEAGANERAIGKWREAGNKALARSANAEAVLHLERAARLIAALEPSEARDREELAMQLARGAALLMVKGQSAAETEACFARARQLSEALGETRETFGAMFGLCRAQLSRGEIADARVAAERLMEMATRMGEPEPRIAALTALSLACFHLVDLDEAERLALECLASFDALGVEARQSRLFAIGQHPAVACSFCIAFVACLRADIRTAHAYQARAVDYARTTGIAFQSAQAEFWRMTIAVILRDDAEALARADALIALTREYPFPHLQVAADVLRASLLVTAGKREEGRELARVARRGVQAQGYRLFLLRATMALAQSCLSPDHVEEGLAAIAEGYQAEDKFGEIWWKPELRRIEGELCAMRGETAANSERLYREARDLARAMGLPLFGLRSSVDLARALLARGEAGEARAALETALAGLAPDLSIADFREAQALMSAIDASSTGRTHGASQELATDSQA